MHQASKLTWNHMCPPLFVCYEVTYDCTNMRLLASGRLDATPADLFLRRFTCLRGARATPNVTSIEKKGRRGSRRRGGRYNTWCTFEIFRWNTCNIHMKAHETLKTCIRNTCKNTWKHLKPLKKHMQHPDKNTCKHMYETYAASR